MNRKSKRIIFHIDVNSAYLSWTAISELKKNNKSIDIRNIPSIIGGSLEDRRGVVLAKSIPAKKFNIITGEPIVSAIRKCPELKVYSPNRALYLEFSRAMYELLKDYSSKIERYSIDEVFMDMSHISGLVIEKANEIRVRIENELGFTVNVGVGNNKLLAKMASDFPKKNSVHTLFDYEIEKKMWPLPVGDLFMVGKSTKKKLLDLNICTIGDLAKYNLDILRNIFKSYADMISKYANGIDDSPVDEQHYIYNKGIGNSITTKKDITLAEEALKVLLQLTESVTKRLRVNKTLCSVVVVSIKSSVFTTYSHQKTLLLATDSTAEIFKSVSKIFHEMWKGEPIRQLGVRVTKLSDNEVYQSSIFDDNKSEKLRLLDTTIDSIRTQFGEKAIVRSSLVEGGSNKLKEENNDYLLMGGLYESWT